MFCKEKQTEAEYQIKYAKIYVIVTGFGNPRRV